jgi:hypothetical protein
MVGSLDASYLDRYRDDPALRIVLPSPGQFQVWVDRPVGHRASWNLWRALQDARGHPRILLCEDDIIFARGWRPFLSRMIAEIERVEADYFLSLYSPWPLVEAPEGGRVRNAPDGYYGTQAVLYAGRTIAEFADYLERNGLDECSLPYDLNLARYADEAGIPIYATCPSIVQHIGRITTGLGPFHQAVTFVPDLAGPAPAALSWHEIPGWFDYQDLYVHVVREARPGARLVEVGCWYGRSAAFLGCEVRRSGKPMAVFAVEHGLGGDALPQTEHGIIAVELVRNLFLCGLNDVVTPIIASSACAAGIFADSSVDFVFIDACHTNESVLNDLDAWWPKIRPGGLLAGHDYAWSGVAAAVHEFFGREGLGIPQSPGCWGVQKSPDSLWAR